MNEVDVGRRVIEHLGEPPAARELLAVLERSPGERAELIGRLYARQDARWLAEMLIDVEEDDLARLHLLEGLKTALR